MQLARAGAVISRTRSALLLSCTQASAAEFRRQTLAPDENSSVDRTGLDYCSSTQCGSELGEDVLLDDSGQRR